MSLKQAVMDQLGDEFSINSVTVQSAVLHGEEGKNVAIRCGIYLHEIFLANDRKIDENHAVGIIRSYLQHAQSRETS